MNAPPIFFDHSRHNRWARDRKPIPVARLIAYREAQA